LIEEVKTMNSKATLYLDPKILKAAKIKAAHSEKTLSYLVNEALKLSLQKDAADYKAIKDRAQESSIPFETVLAKPLVAEMVVQKLLEILGDPESDFKLSPAVKKRLAKSHLKKNLLSAEQVASQLGLKW
jgi:hypothetical protein